MSICDCLSIPLKEIITSESGTVFFLCRFFFHNAVCYKGKKLLKSKGAASSTLKVWFILILAVLNF